MQTIYFKQTFPDGHTWYTSSILVKATAEKQLDFIRKQAAKKGIACQYELATKEEYLQNR